MRTADSWDEDRAEGWLTFLLDIRVPGQRPTSWRTWPTPCRRSCWTATASSTARCSARSSTAASPSSGRRSPPTPGSPACREAQPNGSALALIVASAAQAHRLGETDRAREMLEWLRELEPHSLDVEEGEEEEDL